MKDLTNQAMGNPMAGNSFATRADAQQAVVDLTAPLLEAFSPGCARVTLGATGAHFHAAAADLEGLVRPFWGLAPLLAGGGRFYGIEKFVDGLNNGADPAHPEYWGPVTDRDQRMVESAAIGYALALAPDVFWDGLSPRGRDCLRDWLLNSLHQTPAPNNWNFFHVLVSLGLRRVGIDHDLKIIEGNLDRLEGWDMGNGWYRDGSSQQADHYIPFAMHFYGLIYAQYGPEGDGARRERFRERARRFAPQIAHWYAADGAALPYGRSLTYRFAHAGFWGTLALAGEEVLPWGDIRGFWARNLRWWSDKPICDSRGAMTIGYGYPQLSMSERYNSPGSPYWAMKAFAPLVLPEDHPSYSRYLKLYGDMASTIADIQHDNGLWSVSLLARLLSSSAPGWIGLSLTSGVPRFTSCPTRTMICSTTPPSRFDTTCNWELGITRPLARTVRSISVSPAQTSAITTKARMIHRMMFAGTFGFMVMGWRKPICAVMLLSPAPSAAALHHGGRPPPPCHHPI